MIDMRTAVMSQKTPKQSCSCRIAPIISLSTILECSECRISTNGLSISKDKPAAKTGRHREVSLSMASLENKVAIVTGGGGGIGGAIARHFAREGAKIAVADINAESAQQQVVEIHGQSGE